MGHTVHHYSDQGGGLSRSADKCHAYARATGATVIEEQNLAPHLLVSEVDRVRSNKELHRELSEKAKTFAKPDAAKKAARILVDILKSHEV